MAHAPSWKSTIRRRCSARSKARPLRIPQPADIAQWNLARLAETLLPLIDADRNRAIAQATEVVNGFPGLYELHWLQGMRAKLGLASEDEADLNLVNSFLAALEGNTVDYTLAFRYLAEAALGEEERIRALFADASAYDLWSEHWRSRLKRESVTPAERAQAMRRVNPAFIARNHRVEEALSAAVERADYAPLETLLNILLHPFDEQSEFAAFAEPAPEGRGCTAPSAVPESYSQRRHAPTKPSSSNHRLREN